MIVFYFFQRNNSMDTEGLVEVTTGDSGTLPGQILSWDYHKSLPWYEGECAKVRLSYNLSTPFHISLLCRGLLSQSQKNVGYFPPRESWRAFFKDTLGKLQLHLSPQGELSGMQFSLGWKEFLS